MNDFQFQEQKLKQSLSELRSIYYDYDFHTTYEGSSVQAGTDEEKMYFSQEIDLYEESFKHQAKIIYLTIQAYLELKAMPKYLLVAIEKLDPFFKSSNKLMESGYHEGSGDNYSLFVYECYNILSPFGFLAQIEHQAMLKRTGITYLENILENTAVIIDELEKNPQSEAQVYNAVKIVLKATFPSFADSSSTSFQQTAKCYKPDILLPSLNCAIEYKYAKTETDLINTIDQILIDVNGYGGNKDYRIFYAVFYAKAGIWSEKRFSEVWSDKNFPDNWKGILVNFSTVEKKAKVFQKSNNKILPK